MGNSTRFRKRLSLLLSVAGPIGLEKNCPEKQHVGKDNRLMTHPQSDDIKRRRKNLYRYANVCFVSALRRSKISNTRSHQEKSNTYGTINL